jgi:HAD superfamily hydrolase (TIGR01459 family)
VIVLGGIDALLPRYAAFLVDQFGTLHDGTTLYPGAAAALARMRAAGRRVVLLSNSGRRTAANARRLARLGIGPADYDLFLTSGEAGARLIAEGRIPAARGKRRCLLLEREGEGSILEGLDLTPVDAAEAELVLIAGSEGEKRPLAWYEALLAPLARRGVPALCLNPDRTMLTPRGPAFGAGRIAELYAGLGGRVDWVGKPYPAIYEMALQALGDVAPASVAGVGDSIEHDIAGARRAGCGAWLTRTGIIAGWDDAAIAAECARWGVEPDGVVERFA